MKKLSLWALILAFTASIAAAQDTATQQQLDKLSGQIQDLLDIQEKQTKRIDALEKEVSDLRDKINAPVVNDYATHAELKSLAEQLEEIDQKRKEDTDNIAKQLENLAKLTAATPASGVTVPASQAEGQAPANSSDMGHEYQVKQGENLGIIIKHLREKGVRVTLSQIIAANPKMDPNLLLPGEKIIIPDALEK